MTDITYYQYWTGIVKQYAKINEGRNMLESNEYVEFKPTSSTRSLEPRVSVRKNGQIVLNRATIESVGWSKGETRVVFAYNLGTQTVKLSEYKGHNNGTFTRLLSKQGAVNGLKFLKYHDELPVDSFIRAEPVINRTDSCIEFSIAVEG